ncbi:DUF1173 family protein [Burkholderiaceae bacterium UC74_6]
MNETAAVHIPRIAKLAIGDQVFDADAQELAEAIAQAYREQQRPRCLCHPEGVEMYVAKVGERYLIKRMPDSGAQHAPGCRAFETAEAVSGLEPLLGTAILADPGGGATTLRLDFSLSIQPGRRGPPPVSAVPRAGTLRHAGTRLSLRSMLHYLWDEAGLTQWHPGFKGRRNWERVRQRLLHAAGHKIAGGATLTSRLYVPEAFTLTQRDVITDRRRAAWSCAVRRADRPQQLLLLIGEIKEISPGRHGYKAVIRHIPEVAFSMDETLYRRVENRFADELALWNASDEVRLVAIAPFGLNDLGLPMMTGIYLMTATRHWLPVESVNERDLIDRLVDDERAFSKILRYDLRPDVQMASVALNDAGYPAPLLFAGAVDNSPRPLSASRPSAVSTAGQL